MEQIWKDIDGASLYKVSSNGDVMNKKTGKLRKWQNNGNGYFFVNLITDNGSKKNYYIHRLVAQAFIPNPLGLPEVNHKDEDKSNNIVENLEWITKKDNNNYGTKVARTTKSRNNKCCLNAEKPVICKNNKNEIVAVFNSIQEAARLTSVYRRNIQSCLRGDRKTAGGYTWEAAEPLNN